MKFDDFLTEIGEFGPYQKRVFVLASLFGIVAGYQYLSVVFLLDIPKHRCAIPTYDNDTYAIQNRYHEQLINLSIPLVEDGQGEATLSDCKMYNISEDARMNSSQYDCNAWVYDKSAMTSTVISDFDMVCKNEIYRSVGEMVSYTGLTVGSILCGVLADMYGRKKPMILMVILVVVFTIVSYFSNSYEFYTAVSFFYGIATSGLFMVPFGLVMEIAGTATRTSLGTAMNFFWVIGLFLLTAAAYFVRDWRYLRLLLGLPVIFFLSCWWLLPESPRWLLSKNRKEEAVAIIRKIAKANNVELSEASIKKLSEEEHNDLQIWHMFSRPSLLIRSLIVFFNTFVVSLAYTGLSLNVNNLSGNIYLNFFLSNLVELIAYILTLILLYKIGRRPLLATTMLIGGIACVASIFPVLYGDSSTYWILVLLSLVGKACSSASFVVTSIYVTELFPTVVRESGLAVGYVFANIGSMVSPYVADMGILMQGNLRDALPLIVTGSVTIVAALLDFLLPETRNKPLPETIDDVLALGIQ